MSLWSCRGPWMPQSCLASDLRCLGLSLSHLRSTDRHLGLVGQHLGLSLGLEGLVHVTELYAYHISVNGLQN